MSSLKEKVQESAAYIKSKISITPEVGLVLGSGLGVLAEEITDAVNLNYADIPHFPVSTVAGHSGVLVIGKLGDKPVVVQKGRFHFYEGYDMDTVTFCIRVMRELGVKTVILTNAAGGINPTYSPGELMLIADHVNFMGTNPLIGPNDEYFGTRFPDMAHAYPEELREVVRNVVAEIGGLLREGTYLALTGPSYETPAELRMFRTWDVDAVGMSTVPEVIVANHIGLKVIGISCITNIFIPGKPANHEEVLTAAENVKPYFKKLIKRVVARL